MCLQIKFTPNLPLDNIEMRYSLSEIPSPPPGRTGWPWTEKPEPLPDRMPDGSEWTKISIVTPSYNQGQFIEETIRSILLQGYPNLEYIIIDGGSTDNTIEIIKKYQRFLSYWVSEPDKGQSHAISKGLTRCTGEIFNWINSDDFLSINALSTIAIYFTEEYDLLAGACKNFHAGTEEFEIIKNKNLYLPYLPKAILSIWSNRDYTYHQPGVWLRPGLIFDSGGIDQSLHYCFDRDLMVRYLYFNKKTIYISDIVVNFRLHKDSKTIMSKNDKGKNNFLEDHIHYLKKLSKNNHFLEIHQYCNLRLRQLEWIKTVRNIYNQSHLSKWRKIIKITSLIWKDPIIRTSRFTIGSIIKLLTR